VALAPPHKNNIVRVNPRKNYLNIDTFPDNKCFILYRAKQHIVFYRLLTVVISVMFYQTVECITVHRHNTENIKRDVWHTDYTLSK